MRIIGDVEGKDVLLVDDIVDTAGTMTKAANLMMENGALLGTCALASHPVMSDPATSRIEQERPQGDDIYQPIPYCKGGEKIKCSSVAPMIAESIRRVIE